MQHDYSAVFCPKTLDANGDTADYSLVGKLFKHNGNGIVYQVSKIVFMADSDVWGVEHSEVTTSSIKAVPMVRSLRNFTGNLAENTPRFTWVRY